MASNAAERPVNVVGFDREHFAQRVRRAVAEERPHFHFAEALAAVLRLAAERLLGDERVRTDRAHVDLVLHHVMQFEDVHVADRDVLLERLAGAAVVELHLAVFVEAGFLRALRGSLLRSRRQTAGTIA